MSVPHPDPWTRIFLTRRPIERTTLRASPQGVFINTVLGRPPRALVAYDGRSQPNIKPGVSLLLRHVVTQLRLSAAAVAIPLLCMREACHLAQGGATPSKP